MLVRANTGVIWFQIHVRGRPVHVREVGNGANAIEAAVSIIPTLKALEQKWNSEKASHQYFDQVAHPINFREYREDRWGDWASSVPSWCSLDVRVAIYPGIDPRDAAGEIEQCIHEYAATHPFLKHNPRRLSTAGFCRGYVLEEGSDAEQVLGRAHAQSFGSSLEAFVTPGYLDGRVFVLYDDCPCLVYGPVSKNIHAFDECVSLESLKRVTGTIALFIASWCRLEPLRKSPPVVSPLHLGRKTNLLMTLGR